MTQSGKVETVLDVAQAVIAHNIDVGYVPSDDKGRQRFQELRAAVLDQNEARCQALLTAALQATEDRLEANWPQKRDPRLQTLMNRVYDALERSEGAGEIAQREA